MVPQKNWDTTHDKTPGIKVHSPAEVQRERGNATHLVTDLNNPDAEICVKRTCFSALAADSQADFCFLSGSNTMRSGNTVLLGWVSKALSLSGE